MALPDLTGQNIENTYQRVLQTDGTVIYDGTGSAFLPVSASHAVTASYAEYAVSASHEIIKEVSSSYADYAKESGLSTSSISASYALTASYALNSPDTFPYTGSAIISGSLTVTGSTKTQYLTASGLNYPTIDGDEKQLITTDGSGNLFFDWSDRTNLDVKNTSGVSLSAGTPVYLTGFQGASIFQIAAASSSISSTMPAIGVLDTDLNPNDQGHATLIGAVRNINTSTPGYSINQSLYVGEGILTPNRPTGSALIQKIARVGRVANNGEITVLGAGRSNDIPNLQPGYAWVGDSTWNAVATPTSSFNKDPFPYTGSAIISGSLDVIGDITGSGKINLNDGSNNVLISTGNSTITATNTVAVGHQALTALTTGTENTAVGFEASSNMTTGTANTVVGYQANLSSNASNNTIIGYQAAKLASISNNTIIGHRAANTLNSGFRNTFIGNDTQLNNSQGQDLILIGYRARINAGNGSNSVVIGNFTAASGISSVSVGAYAAGGGSSTTIGYDAGNSNGTNNVFIGYQAGKTEAGSNKLYIENSNSTTPLIYGEFDNDTVRINGKLFVSNSLDITGSVSASTYYGDGSNLTGISSDPFPYTGSAIISGSLDVIGDITGSSKINLDNGNGTIIIGNGAGTNVTTAVNNVIIGNNAADIMTVSPNNVIIGAEAGPRYTTGYGQHVILGYQAGRGADQNNDDRCVIIGTRAGYQDVGLRTVAIGFEAAYASNASFTISIGFNAHRNINVNASNQIAIGYEAGYGAQGANSIFIGRDSGRTSSGTNIQALGNNAGRDADGNYNVAIGTNAAYNVNGDNNIAIGYQSLRNASGIIYNNTIALGHEAGYAVSGSNNILLGYQAGYNLTGSNQLIIANNSSSALVTGDFANSTFNISGSVSASTYYGDGSNLTGISSDPFPYTGSAEISGSLTINGGFNVITPTKTRNSVSVTNSEIKFLLADNGNDNQAVTITRDGSTSSDVVALKIGSNITIKRNGGGTPSFSVGNAGFTYQQDYNGNSITNSNPFNNGAGMGIKNTTPGSPVILGLLRNGVFGAVNTAGSTLNICNPYGFANSTGTNLYTATQNVNFRNTSTLEISYGPASGSNDVDIIRYQSANTDSVTDYRHGLQLSSIPNAGASTSNGKGYATNGSNVIDMDTVGYDVRGFVKVGQSIYIHEGWTTSIQNSSNPIRFTITGVDYINETITLDSNWTGATGNVSCWIEDTLVVIRNYDGNERFRFYGDGTLKLQSNITASGHVSASTYYGDGSNLTGISSDPFPYTGSAVISGSLTLTGSFNALLPTSSTDTYFVTYNTASYELEARQVATLINPKVEYTNVTSSIDSGVSITLPNGLSYVSSSVYEYLEVFMNGLRLRYNMDFIPTSTTTIQTQVSLPSGSELTFKSLKA